MRCTLLCCGFSLFVLAPALWAQRLSGEGGCTKPEVAHPIPVGDHPNHVFMVSRATCTWTKPFEIAGTQSKGGAAVQFDEIRGNTSRFHGHFLDVMTNGDTARYQYQGTTNLKDGKPQSAQWSWTYAGGSGKLTNLKGKGSCRGSWDSQGINSWRCTGEYRLPK